MSARVARCVQSLLAQTEQDLEVLCMDDGSQDNTFEVLENIALRDRRVHVFTQANAGVAAARNALLKAARGEWICFVDADDYLAHETSREVLSCAQHYDMVVFDMYYHAKNKIKKCKNVRTRTPIPLDRVQLFNAFPVCTARFYRRDFLRTKDCFFADYRTFEDVLFCYHLYMQNPRTLYLPRAFYHYVQNKNSLSYKYDEKKFLLRLRAIDCFFENEKWAQHLTNDLFFSYVLTRFLKTFELALGNKIARNDSGKIISLLLPYTREKINYLKKRGRIRTPWDIYQHVQKPSVRLSVLFVLVLLWIDGFCVFCARFLLSLTRALYSTWQRLQNKIVGEKF